MEPEGLSSCLQEPAPWPHPESHDPLHTIASHYLKPILISSHLRLGLASALFSSTFFHQNSKNKFIFSLVCATCRTHLIMRDLIILIMYCEKCNHEARHYTVFWSPATFSLLDPNILLGTLFLNTLGLCFSFSLRDQISHPYKKSSTL